MQQPALQPPVVAINEAGHKAYHGNTVAGINEAGHKAYHGSTVAGINEAGHKAYHGSTTKAEQAAAGVPAAARCRRQQGRAQGLPWRHNESRTS